MTKELRFNDEARSLVFKGVQKLAQAVKTTLGPTGRNVIIKKKDKDPFITKDGVTVAKEVELEDKFENLGAELVREVASRTASAAGDGTTTATVLAEAILNEGARHLATGINTTELKRGIEIAVKAVVEEITSLSRPVKTKQEMYQVASISANNDTQIGEMLSDLIDEIGSDGVATIEKSGTTETFIEKVDGLQLRGGYITHYFANKENGEAVWDNPRILIYSGRITAARDLILGNGQGFLEKALNPAESRPVVIIADGVDGEALHALVMNRVQGGQKILAVKTPFSLDKSETLEDVAILTGGKVFSREAGHNLHKIELDDLGEAERVVATKDRTLILRGKGDSEKITQRVGNLRTQAADTDDETKKRSLKERAAKLNSGIAVIKVGGSSDVELRERHDRVEDALFATQAAVDEGIVPGGGVVFVRCIKVVQKLSRKLDSDAQKIGAAIIEKALAAPLKQIASNAGISGEVVLEKVLEGKGSVGFNARDTSYCDLIKTGIIDPAKVAKTAIENAASVAGLLLTTDALLVETSNTTTTVTS